MNFLQRVIQITQRQNSLLCVGLDPDVKRLPGSLKSDPEPLFKFCSAIVASTQHAAAAFKINLAFFEAEGSKGWSQLEKLVGILPAGVLKIADAKRGDIGTSSEMYARAILERLVFDAVTVNPYLGRDSVEPFLNWPEKGAFVLGLTSNPGSRDFQYLASGSKKLYEAVIEKVLQWNARKNCGLVVGATHPEEMAAIRKAAPQLPFLIPGVGAQGGSLRDAVWHGTDDSGGLVLINSSRGIIYQSTGPDFADAAKAEAERLQNEINQLRNKSAIKNDSNV